MTRESPARRSLTPALGALIAACALALPASVGADGDRRAPGPPRDIEVQGGEKWSQDRNFTVTWSNPDHPSTIDMAYYRLCPVDDQRRCQDAKQGGRDIDQLRLTLPAPGDYTLTVWLKDERGRSDQANQSRAVRLRFDDQPPTSPGIERGADGDPSSLAVEVADKLSGIARTEIELRAQNGGASQTLPTEAPPGSGRVTARVPELPAGTYEVRALVEDLAGNLAEIAKDTNGDPMRLTLPLRERTGIAARAEVTRMVRRCRPVVRRVRGRPVRRSVCTNVATRQPVPLPTTAPLKLGHDERLLITGRLDEAPRAATIAVVERPRTPGLPGRSSRVAVAAGGSFQVALEPGPSRTVELSYAGDAKNLPSTAQATLLVRAASTLVASRRVAVNGQSVLFSGRLLRGPMPDGGRTVDLQAFYRGAWRTFATPRTAQTGAWRHLYRFGATRGSVVYPFRVLIQRDAGYPYETGVSPTVRVAVRGR